MDRTNNANSYTRSNTKNGNKKTLAQLFFTGMENYALSRSAQAEMLCKLSAASAIGILLGVFSFFLWGERVRTEDLADAYFRTRAFSAFASAADYMTFFAECFFHYAIPLSCALLCALSCYPAAGCAVLCCVRGFLAGFSVCVMSGAFSGFTIFYAAAQGAVCAILLMFCTKCTRYGRQRRTLPASGHKQFSLPWLASETAPLLCGFLLSCGVIMAGILCISCTSCFFI